MALSNLPAIIAGIKTQLETATIVKNVLTRPPDAPSNHPLLYFLKPRWRRIDETYGEQAIEWTFEGVAAVTRLNRPDPEGDLNDLIVQVISVSGQDLDAGGTITDGHILIMSGTTEYGTIQKIPVIAHTFTIVVIERVLYTFAL